MSLGEHPHVRTLPARGPGAGAVKWVSRRLAVLVLALFAVVIGFARLHTFNEPIDRDLATYAVIGHELLEGRRLYSDLWDHKPPAIHVVNAAAQLVAGYGPQSIYLLNVMAAVLSMLGVYAAASSHPDGRSVGLVAAALWTVVSGDLFLQANQPNTEVFQNVGLVWAFAFLLRLDGGVRDRGRVVAAAGCLAAASLFKPVVVATAATLAVAHVVAPPAGVARRRAVLEMATMAVIGATAWIAVLVFFAATGRLHDFVADILVFNRSYGGNLAANILQAMSPRQLFPSCMRSTLPLVVVVALGVAAGRPRLHRRASLALGYAFGAGLAVGLPGQFFPHYYQLWLPVLAVTAAWSLHALADRVAVAPGRFKQVAAGCLIAGMALIQLPWYTRSADDWSRLTYGQVFVDARTAAAAADKVLAPGETLYEWGAEPSLYFYSHRAPPSGVFSLFPLLHGPLVRELSARVVADLGRRPPELVLAPEAAPLLSFHPVVRFLMANYEPAQVPGMPATYRVFVRRGGALEERLQRLDGSGLARAARVPATAQTRAGISKTSENAH